MGKLIATAAGLFRSLGSEKDLEGLTMKKILMLLAASAAMFGQQSVTLTAVAPPPVQGLGAAVVGTAGTTFDCYWVVVNYVGGGILSAAPTCLPNVPGTLNSTNYVQISWQTAAGLNVTYDVLKTTTNVPPVAGASSSLATGLTTTTTNDQGGALSAYTIAPFPYATGSVLVRINNRDYTVPGFECIGNTAIPCQDTFDFAIPKQGAAVMRLGSRSTPFTIDNTGAFYVTQGSSTPGSPVGVTTAGGMFSVSANLTLAQVNAGTTILPAVIGQTYKVQHVSIQAIGGAAAACTLVEVADTAASPIVAMSSTVAGLTQNTRVTESSAATIAVTTAFAPTALTAGKGIQVLSTCSACTTATSFNVVVFFTINY
jgi:hypothetical protein